MLSTWQLGGVAIRTFEHAANARQNSGAARSTRLAHHVMTGPPGKRAMTSLCCAAAQLKALVARIMVEVREMPPVLPPDLEQLRMALPILGCWNPRCVSSCC